MKKRKKISVGSDFSGVGAFDQALMRLGLDYETIFACDMDKYARQTYTENYGEPDYFPENVYNRDVPEDPLTIYMTSPPCQAFSLAGRRKGESDKRGVLFYNSYDFIVKNRPRYFIFENVKGLLSDDGGKTFKRWLDYLGGSINGTPVLFPLEGCANYHIYYKVLNSKNFGVPQNRERVFIIGIRDDKDNDFRFPKGEHLALKLRDVLEDAENRKYLLSREGIKSLLSSKIDNKYYLSEKAIIRCLKSQANSDVLNKGLPEVSRCIIAGYYKIPFDGQYIVDDKYYLPEKMSSDSDDVDTILKKYPKLEKGKGNVLFHRKGFCTNTQVYDKNKLSGTIDTMQGGGREPHVLITNKIRRLTPRECFRLQDFPEEFYWTCSDTQAYKQAGNSITVSVLEKIIKNLNLKL